MAGDEGLGPFDRRPGHLVCLLDATGQVLYASPEVERLFGIAADLTGGENLRPIHPDDVDAVRATWAAVTATPGATRAVDARFTDGRGGWRIAELTGTNLLGTPVGAVLFTFRDLSERLAAEELLRESEGRLRSILEYTSDGLVLVDENQAISWVNPALSDLLGYRPEEVVGHGVLDYVHPADRQDVTAALEGPVLGGRRSDPVLVRTRHHDGSWRWTEVVARGVDTVGSGPAAMYSLRDVTARVEAEQAMRQQAVRWRTVMDHSYDVVAVIGPDSRVKWVTPNCVRMLGWRPEELEGRVGLDLVHPDDLELMLSELRSFAGGDGIPNPTPVKMRHRDGTWRHVEVVGTDFLQNPDVEGIALSVRNIDEKVALERDRRRLLEIFELSSDLVLTATLDGQLVYLNAQARRFFGIPPKAKLGRIDMAAWVGPEIRGELEDLVPTLLDRDGMWAGEFELVGAQGARLPVLTQIVGHRDAEGNLEYVSAVCRDISERKAFETRLAHDATHDPLTGLPNRAMLIERLEAALARGRRHGTSLAVLFCDLDNFKVVNDSMGHSQGDRLLTLVADRLRAQLRPEDTVARFGGDEFVVLCDDVAGAAGAEAVARRVVDALARSFDVDGSELFVGVSVGIAVADPHRLADAETLIRDADAAMYGAKLGGRNRYQLFEPGMWEQAMGRLDLENALRGALSRGEFELWYQPIYHLGTGLPVSVEALLRWNHPERGLLTPSEFIAVAEETGLIVPIGTWVLEQALRQLGEWRATEPGFPSVSMALNISGRQLEHPDFVGQVASKLADSGVEPDAVHLEVTESVLMHDVAQSQRVLGRLRDLGVHLGVDDFGTGYSSLSYLKRFPVDTLKVDRSFVDGLGAEAEDSAIVTAIISLAHSLGLVAVAEGVETTGQADALRALGCDLVQGFLLARPLDPGSAGEVLRAAWARPVASAGRPA